MRTRSMLTLVVATVMAVAPAMAQDEPAIKVIQITEHIYQLITDQGAYTTTTLVSVGPDGLLLVDTQHSSNAEDLKKAVEAFGKGVPRYIINTHRHVEHVGGNSLWGDEPVIIAHDLVRTKLRSGSYLFDEFPDSSLPDITLTDVMSLYFNGEEIRLKAMPGSHDDNEVIVHFTKSKVVHLSSLANGFNFPSVDAAGDVLMFERLVAEAIELLPEDVVIVSGHNRNGTIEDLKAYHDMLVKTAAAVRTGLAKGQDVSALQEAKILAEWQAYAGSYVSPDDWIESLAEAIEGGNTEKRKTVYEPLYYALKEKGAEGALALYRELKKSREEEFDFYDTDLLVIGNKLAAHGKPAEAVAILEAALDEYPDSQYVYYGNYSLAQAYQALGDVPTAIGFCEKALELRPDSQAIKNLLEELKSAS